MGNRATNATVDLFQTTHKLNGGEILQPWMTNFKRGNITTKVYFKRGNIKTEDLFLEGKY